MNSRAVSAASERAVDLPEPARRLLAFIEQIGLEWAPAELDESTLLPGLCIRAGRLLVDGRRLAYPGDILHEAGHIAVTPAADRSRLGPAELDDPGLEMAAMAWSYAACVHLGIAAELVFHAGGYRGGGSSILTAFRTGGTIGQPLLAWLGMTTYGSGAVGPAVYPAMLKWLRD
jgi:hypothetical protein